jgi:hypothetical protein
MTIWAPGIGYFAQFLPMTTLPVLADKHFAMFAIDLQHVLPALGAFTSGEIVMSELVLTVFYVINRLFGVIFHIVYKSVFMKGTFGNTGR